MIMARSSSRKPSRLFTIAILLHAANAQVGTITQDVKTMSGFNLQKPCAQSCFQTEAYCPNDFLGSAIGCKTRTDCNDNNWQATNDCYCRSDLQQPAQDYLSSCISSKCDVGDVNIDAASAGSIYGQYCMQKGYSPAAAPATVQATVTGGSGAGAATKTAAGGLGTGPTASTTSDSNSSGGSTKLSTSTIIGIVVGGLAGLAFLTVTLKIVLKWCGVGNGGHNNKPPPYPQQPLPMHQQPVYPTNLYQEPYFPHPKSESELTPDDSASMVTPMPRVPPTTLSATHSYSHRY